MKIAIVVHFFPKISETFILNQITKLIDFGVDVRIFAVANPRIVKAGDELDYEVTTHPDVVKYSLIDKVTYFPTLPNGNLDYLKIKELINEEAFEIIHFQWSNQAEDLLSNVSFNAPIITTFQSFRTPKLWNIVRQGFNLTFNRSSLILPASDYIRRGLEALGCPKNKIVVQHMGVDVTKFSPINRSARDRHVFKILSIGRFVEKKGFQDAIETAHVLNGTGLKFEYSIIGDGILRDSLREQADRLGLSRVIHFLGKLDQDQVISEYRNSDLVFQPSALSLDDDEGIPTVLMEAQACALPVVSTYHTGIPEIVDNEKSGLLSHEHDIIGFSQNILRLSNDENMRSNMGLIGRDIVMRQFNIDTLVKRLIELYDSVAKN